MQQNGWQGLIPFLAGLKESLLGLVGDKGKKRRKEGRQMRRDENEELGGDPTPANNFTNRPLQWL